jgi:hypothetical protein
METKIFKRLPYGNSDFRDIVLQNYAYVDKTRFIEQLENESNRNHFFIRPRKFGKSLFLRMLNCRPEKKTGLSGRFTEFHRPA